MAQAFSRRPPIAEARSVHVGFVMDKVALGQVFSPSTSVFPCQFHFTGAPLHGKMKKKLIFIFITGLHNKPDGCGASVASAAGSFLKKNIYIYIYMLKNLHTI
jgi:hypothetical protein